MHLTANLRRNLPAKKNCKSVKNWQNYGHESVAPFFCPTVYMCDSLTMWHMCSVVFWRSILLCLFYFCRLLINKKLQNIINRKWSRWQRIEQVVTWRRVTGCLCRCARGACIRAPRAQYATWWRPSRQSPSCRTPPSASDTGNSSWTPPGYDDRHSSISLNCRIFSTSLSFSHRYYYYYTRLTASFPGQPG